MLAVEQMLPRTQVIKTTIKLFPKLRFRDSNNSTVFHHCLNSNHGDETCSEHLKIILHGKDARDVLSKDDINGDTAISIAISIALLKIFHVTPRTKRKWKMHYKVFKSM